MKLKDFVIITKALDLECFEHDENITACIQWRISFVDFAERIIAHKNLKRMEFMSISKIKMWAKCVVTLVLIWIKKRNTDFYNDSTSWDACFDLQSDWQCTHLILFNMYQNKTRLWVVGAGFSFHLPGYWNENAKKSLYTSWTQN